PIRPAPPPKPRQSLPRWPAGFPLPIRRSPCPASRAGRAIWPCSRWWRCWSRSSSSASAFWSRSRRSSPSSAASQSPGSRSYSAEQQRQFYPDIEPIELEITVDRAYAIALQLVNKRKWLVIDERAPQPPRRIGRIEAVARTPIMGLREDISIRVVPDGEDSRVDIRSASRYFESDL